MRRVFVMYSNVRYTCKSILIMMHVTAQTGSDRRFYSMLVAIDPSTLEDDQENV